MMGTKTKNVMVGITNDNLQYLDNVVKNNETIPNRSYLINEIIRRYREMVKKEK